jgi:hypothetical protein
VKQTRLTPRLGRGPRYVEEASAHIAVELALVEADERETALTSPQIASRLQRLPTMEACAMKEN